MLKAKSGILIRGQGDIVMNEWKVVYFTFVLWWLFVSVQFRPHVHRKSPRWDLNSIPWKSFNLNLFWMKKHFTGWTKGQWGAVLLFLFNFCNDSPPYLRVTLAACGAATYSTFRDALPFHFVLFRQLERTNVFNEIWIFFKKTIFNLKKKKNNQLIHSLGDHCRVIITQINFHCWRN